MSKYFQRETVLRYAFLFVTLYCSIALAQPSLKVSFTAWQNLSSDERSIIQQKFVIETVGEQSFGTIIDNQGVDRSTPGTNGGTVLGEAIAGASYIDKSFGNGNYSAKNHLGAMLLGGVLGSTLDRKPYSQYQFRYAIRLGSGNVIYQDTYSTDSFRHPVGVCVFLPDVVIAPEQHLCSQTAESLRGAHITQKSQAIDVTAEQRSQSAISAFSKPIDHRDDIAPIESIACKVKTLAPVKTSPEKCRLINGIILND